ncbi:MAG TPA: type I DNA topoisomerase [Clostridia bacterium]|nr:type I DNA topoisomerase [Clostridia bacterium]
MADKLIIVESPAKAGTIQKFLGGSTKVIASMGHVRDLPKSKLGVNIDKDFEPEYINIRGKGDLIKKLKKEAKNAKKIFLATDPDREGEAIAWHLASLLNIPQDSICRVTFNEITKEAVQKSIKNPTKIDKNLIDAQQARRILDRIVGYKISPVLWKKVKKGLSAGRVQSVAVKLIADREDEIEKFIPEEYWNIYANLSDAKSKKIFESKFYGKNGKKIELKNSQDVKKILDCIENSEFVVNEIKKSEKKRTPAPPFTTSTMQQEASRKLNFNLKRTMMIAQNLYEGVRVPEKGSVGLITYMRTDSTRISEEARSAAKEHIVSTFGESYYENRYYKTKGNAQDAHEAIRPTYINMEPEKIKDSLTPEQYKLYKLIYNRFIASQMAQAIFDTVSVDIGSNNYNFKSNGQTLKFKGFMALYVESLDENEEEENIKIPELSLGQKLEKISIDSKQSFTEPPPRYTEASLVKALEEKGIGRPSTYSPTITTILARRYIERVQKQLIPTELGRVVNKLLIENFPDVINAEFTAEIEQEFDEVAEGKEDWKNVIKQFYSPFEKVVLKVEKELEHVKLVEEVSDVKCDKCGKMMVVRFGKYGKFLACPGFPDCRNIASIVETIDEPCPVCGGKVEIRKTKKRKNYYICENNKNDEVSCKYISWNKPKEGEVWNLEKIDVSDKKSVKKQAAKKTAAKKHSIKNKINNKKTNKKATK